jgi:hypothetical protein
MANKNAKEVVKKATTNAKEATTMKKAIAKAPKTAEKKVEEKKVEETKVEKKSTEKKVENKKKENTTVSISEVEKLYTEAGIKVYNPNIKGNYRIMGHKKGSSLNLRADKYIIYSTNEDFTALESVKGKYSDLTLTKGGNAQDDSRPNVVEVTALETLKAILKVYATNPLNKVPAAS